MKTFHCTYKEMMEEPYEVVQANMMIMSIEAEEQDKQDKMERLKAKIK
jgi:hypothetical protein